MFKLNIFLIRFLPYLYTATIWLNFITSKAFNDIVELYYIKGVQKQRFADVLQNMGSLKFGKTHRKTPMLESFFNKVPYVLFYGLCEIFKDTYFLITPQNQTMLLRQQISKVTQRRQSHVCSLVFYKVFFGVDLFFFSKSKGRILDELRVSFKFYKVD